VENQRLVVHAVCLRQAGLLRFALIGLPPEPASVKNLPVDGGGGSGRLG